jgi:hypothetical protein
MGIFTDGDDDDDELMDFFRLNEIHEDSNKSDNAGGNKAASGGCLTSLVLMLAIPALIIGGVIAVLT